MSLISHNPKQQLKRYHSRLNRAVKHQLRMREALQRVAQDLGVDAAYGEQIAIKPYVRQAIRVWKADAHVQYLLKRVAYFSTLTDT